MELYHASNADFEKFSSGFIKSASENDKYGYGFYFASTLDDAARHCYMYLKKDCNIYTCKILGSDHIVDYLDMIDRGQFLRLMFKLEKAGYGYDAQSFREEFEEYGESSTYREVYDYISAVTSNKVASQMFEQCDVTGFRISQDTTGYQNPVYLIFNPDDIKILYSKPILYHT